MKADETWIINRKNDLCFIILPGILISVLIIILGLSNKLPDTVSPFSWLIFVVLIDVAHVWSTIFRTYLNKKSFDYFKKELFLFPLFIFIIGFFIHLYSIKLFWTLMAYIAVYHFIKQQVGFLKIYLRKEKRNFWNYKIDLILIYLSTIIPIIIWHLEDRSFDWFRDGDFIYFSFPYLKEVLLTSYFFLLALYIYKIVIKKTYQISAVLLLLNTALVWFVGIVLFDNDWAFTLSNVINHGIPYFALIYFSSYNVAFDSSIKTFTKIHKVYKLRLILFFVIVFSLALSEEFLWDKFVWHENSTIFGDFLYIDFTHTILSIFVALLATPQVTHYFLDGIIWKSEHKIDQFKF